MVKVLKGENLSIEITVSHTVIESSIDEQTLQLAMEDWAISQRWQANHSSPEDSERDKEIRRLLAEKLTIDPEVDIKAAGEFQPALGEIENKSLTDPIGNLQVRWHTVEAS